MKSKIKSARHLAMCLIVAMLSFGLFTTVSAEPTYHVATHTFTVNDIQGDFDGNTVADDPSIMCLGGCPGEAQPFTDKSGVTLYPVDSEFGFIVSDFVGAAPKVRDANIIPDYAEGWAGNIGDPAVGVMISNAATDFFKVKYPMGTWCAGLGANTVKCSTERYTVLEHLMSCYETVPYMFAADTSYPGLQGELIDPATGLPVEGLVDSTCNIGKLDNDLYKVVNGVVDPLQPLLPDADGRPDLPANESTVLNDVAVGNDYGITKKDDGKPLYRFGNLVKRPNDIRMYARMELPASWKAEGANFDVTRAELIIQHLVTNNPNDQIRPEDMENEAAIGRLPRFNESGTVWTSPIDCYEGDGDFIPAGTILKNGEFALPAPVAGVAGDPTAYSADLREAMTNAWYTTTDREPFEWSYDSNGDGSTDISSGAPLEGAGTLLSGPRWRLLPNKFGQDIPGLEIPKSTSGHPACIPVPYTSEFIKYEVGTAAITTINLLDWGEGPSPLATSAGWVDAAANIQNLGVDGNWDAPNGLSINGLPMTEDFDLAVYIKGDRKPTAVYNATLVIEYDGDGSVPPPVGEYDVSLDSLKVPKTVRAYKLRKLTSEVSNNGSEIATGVLSIVGRVNGVVTYQLQDSYYTVAPSETVQIKTGWTAPDEPMVVEWTATINTSGDITPDNNELTATTNVKQQSNFQ